MAMKPLVGTHRAGRLLYSIGLGGALVLLLAGCGAGGSAEPIESAGAGPTAAESSAGESSTSISAGQFGEAFIAEGMDCEELDRDDLRAGVVEQVVCRGSDTVIVTIRNYESADARDHQLGVIQDSACEIAKTGQDIQRVAVSDTWLVMPGGDREVDFAVFGNAMTTLGLDWSDYTC